MVLMSARVGAAAALAAAVAWSACGCDDTPEKEPVAGPGSAPAPTPSVARTLPPPRVPAGMTAGYVVFDRRAGRVAVEHDARRTFRSASVVKILIALDHLREHRGTIPPADLAMLRPMLRSSDDGAATALWARGGERAIVERMARRLGLARTAPPPADRPGFWGYTAISAADIVRTYRYLFDEADRRDRDFILGELRRATRCAEDDFDQFFGIPGALRGPWAVKQGWSGYGAVPARPCRPGPGRPPARPAAGPADPALGLGRPVLHTTGTVGAGDRWIVVVLTSQPAGSPFASSAARLTTLTRQVYRAAGG